MTKEPSPVSAAPPRRWRRRLIIGLLLLLVLFWATPKIVAWTPLRDWLVRKIFARVDGTIHVGSASLGWFSPVVLRDVTVTDPAGVKLLHVARIESGKNLLTLAFRPRDLGSFRFENPALQVRFGETDSNVEAAIAKYLAPPEAPASKGGGGPGRALDLEIVDGAIRVHDEATRSDWRFAAVAATVKLAAGTETPVRANLKATCVADKAPGRLDVQLTIFGTAHPSGECKVDGEAVPLAALNPLWRRLGDGLHLSGSARAKGVVRWNREPGAARLQLEADLGGEQVVASGAWLGGDRLQLGKVELPARLAAVGSRLHVDEARVSCDLGRASVRGGIDLAQPGGWLHTAGWSLTADCDLARLANQLPTTLRLQPGTQITAGRLTLACGSQAKDDGVVWEGKLHTTALEGRRDGKPLRWPEPVNVDFRARAGDKGLPIFDNLRCESRFLRIQGSGSAEQLTVRADLDLNALAAALGQFIDLGKQPLAGQGTAQLAVRATANGRYTFDADGRFQNFHVIGLAEPAVDFKLAGAWHADDDTLDLSDGLFQSSTLTLKTNGLRVAALSTAGRTMSGKLTVQGDVGRLRQWLRDPSAPPPTPMSGALLATLNLQTQGDSECDLVVTDFIIGPAKSPYWREPRLHLYAKYRRDAQTDTAMIERLLLESQALTCVGKGRLTHVSTRKDLDFQGTLSYDLEKLEPQLRPFLGAGVKATGGASRPLHLTGPLNPPGPSGLFASLTGETALNWKSLRAYGADAGPAEVQLQLAKGRLQTGPIATTVSKGQLRVEPSIRLEPGPVELHLKAGKVLERAQLTPAMGASALAYALPVLAGVTAAQGELSLQLDNARILLAAPEQSEIAGKITVHAARFGGTPLIRELGVLFKVPPLGVEIRESVVPFRMADGKVHHKDLDLIFTEMTVRTSGWVGVDGSLSLVAETAIPPRWIGSGKLSAALSRQRIYIPIHGTLDRPRIDEPALRAAMTRVLRESAGNLLQNELENRLKKLMSK